MTKAWFHGQLIGLDNEHVKRVFSNFDDWLKLFPDQPVFVSDNPAYDWQWINHYFHVYLRHNPFGHSARRISDFYAGFRLNFRKTQEWKRLRITPHDHNPVNDAMGNVEAFDRIMERVAAKLKTDSDRLKALKAAYRFMTGLQGCDQEERAKVYKMLGEAIGEPRLLLP
jgi:hypothetical protein